MRIAKLLNPMLFAHGQRCGVWLLNSDNDKKDLLMTDKQARKPKPSFSRLAASIANTQKIRRALRKPSGFKMVIADGIALVNPGHWDQVTAETTFFLSRQYLQMLEQSGPENITPRYALIYEDNLPVAAVYLQIITVTGSKLGATSEYAEVRTSPFALFRKVLGPAARQLRNQIHERLLVCGNVLTYGFHGVAFAPGRNKRELWPAVAEAIYRIRRAEKLAGQTDFIMIKDVTPGESDDIGVLSHLSYRSLETEPNMMLQVPVEWTTYDAYLASLASKYRSSVRQQILKPIEEAGCTVEQLTGLQEHAACLHDLYLQVHEKAALRPFTLPANYFAALEAAAGDNLRCSVIRQNGQLIGFIMTLKDGETGFGYHIGFDRNAGDALPLYLRLLHASIADAVALGCRQLSLGRTALEPKARLGALPQPITVWVRHRQPVINMFVRNLLGIIKHEEAPERSPFKKSA